MKIRESVMWFAEQMEMKLRKHDEERGEDGWVDEDDDFLYGRLIEECKELRCKLDDGWLCLQHIVIEECADIANFSMMIADKCR